MASKRARIDALMHMPYDPIHEACTASTAEVYLTSLSLPLARTPHS